MIQPIKKTFIIVLLVSFFISCKFSSQENKSVTSQSSSNKLNESIDGYWTCEKYEIDIRFSNSKYGIDYANEFKNNFSFTIKNDSITIGSCKEELYKYDLNNPKKGSESVFGVKSKSQSKIKILSTYESKFNTCFPLDNLAMYNSEDNQIVIHDKGYFFYCSKSNTKKNKDCKKEGVLGNPKNYWKLECDYSESVDIVYQNYLKAYPFSSKFLPEQRPKKNYIDDENNISYRVSKNKLEIFKSNPMGIIYTSLTSENEKGTVHLIFEMRYPEY